MSADARTNEKLLDIARSGVESALAFLVERERNRLKWLKEMFRGMPGGGGGI
jgi:hypothetical protein